MYILKKLLAKKTWFNLAPVLLVVIIALVIAFQNIKPNTYYTGWDNIHAEFDLARYARQVIFGAWLEHQGLGSPAGLAQLSEIPRLPILFVLTTILPSNLVRYSFIFIMFTLGGVGMYYYLSRIWITKQKKNIHNWIAALGAVLYLLHTLTLQQFYISFELFTVQFGMLPFVLLSLHQLVKKVTARSLLLFVFIQLLIAPSGHTPTLFYLGMLFSLMYSFFIALQNKNILQSIKFAVLVGSLTVLANAYWIAPNLYYSFHDSHYVEDSRENSLFSPESLASIREAGTYSNILRGTHYLFNWKDYSFEEKQYEYIFQEWMDYFGNPVIAFTLETIGRITLIGLLLVIFSRQKGTKRFAIIAVYLACVVTIWINMSPLKSLLDYAYQNKVILEAFRNPFTKLSIIYTFVSVLLFTTFVEAIITNIEKIPISIIKKYAKYVVLFFLFSSIVLTAWPSFQSNFISEKLRIEYPAVYQQLFTFMKSKSPNLRVLPLPQQSAVGWEYYDWTFLGKKNGYQGMGFLFSAIPQPVLSREADRWVESNDFFYHQLEYALDTEDVSVFNQVLEKYNVDLVVIDETKFEPGKKHDYASDHKIVEAAGLTKIWEQEFLSVYERKSYQNESVITTPSKTVAVSYNVARNVSDYVYQAEGNYVEKITNEVKYPFSDLLSRQIQNVVYDKDGVTLTSSVLGESSTLHIPGVTEKMYQTPVAISLKGKSLFIRFPKNSIAIDGAVTELPGLQNSSLTLEAEPTSMYVLLNGTGVLVNQGVTTFSVISLDTSSPISLSYSSDVELINEIYNGNKKATLSQPIALTIIYPDWQALKNDINLPVQNGLREISIRSEFPMYTIDLNQNVPTNCSTVPNSTISTDTLLIGYRYLANDFGVNCTGYANEYLTAAYPFLIHVTGSNIRGRGIKLFINHQAESASSQQYLFTERSFDHTVVVHPAIPTGSEPSDLTLNWETRSFGRENITELSNIQAFPLPIDQLSRISLLPDAGKSMWHAATLESVHSTLGEIHTTQLTCDTQPCLFGLDQSYDDMWLAFSLSESRLLPHFRLNGWENSWEIQKSGTVIVFYLPELVSLLGIGLLTTLMLLLFRVSRINMRYLMILIHSGQTRMSTINKKLRRQLLSDINDV